MTLLLAIDTTAGTSVALLENSEVIAQVHHDSGMKHAELIGNAISEVFKLSGKLPAQVTAVACGRGPGLFTGLRVGISAAVMFALGREVPIFGAVSLDAVALNYLLQAKASPQELLVTADARRGEIYWALYSGLDSAGLPKVLEPASVGKREVVIERLENYQNLHEISAGATAASVARLVDRQLSAGVASHDVSALYLRAPDAAEPKPHQIFGKRVTG